MASGDGSDRTGRQQRQPDRQRTPNQQPSQRRAYDPMWDIDPAEIDRYLSGRPTREQEAGAAASRQPRPAPERSEGTAGQLDRLRRAVSDRGGQSPVGAQQQRPPAQGGARPPQRQSRGTTTGREQFAAPEGQATAQRRPAAQQGAPRRQQPPRQQETYAEDLGYDDELYSDDPYLDPEHEDEWAERPVRRTSIQKPQIRLNKPNIPRPVMPAAIANAPLSNDTVSLSLIGVGILGLAIMAFTLSSRLDSVPSVVATHVSASGVLEDLRARDALWRIPLMATMLMLMNIIAAWFFSTIDQFAARFILAAGLLVQFVAWVAVIRYLW